MGRTGGRIFPPNVMSDSSSSREDSPGAHVTSVEDVARRRQFDGFAREHRGFLRGLAIKLCRSQFDPDDLVQDVLERAWKHFGDLPEANPRAWLARVMQNLFIDWVRRRASAPRPVAVDDVPLAAPPPVVADWWTEVSPDEVRAKVDELGPELRDAFVLHAFEDCSYIVIAERLGIPKATVGTRLLRARKKLKRLLSAGHAAAEDDDE
jgi:RNA polymerase sigma-70 factor, ECF subfamily